ncbi:MAG: Fic family protein [Egibacteraceae bacterium]
MSHHRRLDADHGGRSADAEEADASQDWMSVGVDDEVVWETQVAARIPVADRNYRYRPSVPAMIAHEPVRLDSRVFSQAEDAALALRSADERVADGASTVPLLRTESAASSKIEQIEVAQRYIGRALAGLPTKQRSAIEVADNVRALHSAVSADLDTLTATQIHRVHATLLPGEDWSGTPRTVQNWIAGSDYSPRGARYVPPRPERVPALMDDLAVFANRHDMPAVVQAAIAHAQFETIHPYPDGNGRVGRALAHMILRRRGVTIHAIAPLSIAVLAGPAAYLDGLTGYERGDMPGWVSYFCSACITAAIATQELSRRLTELRDEWRLVPQVANARADAAIGHIIDELTSHPVCTAAQVSDRLGVSRPAARGALESLTEAGVLNRTTAARNLKIYEAHEVFAAIDDVERAVVGRGRQ